MKKLLSVFLAVMMIFSCCTLAVDALYLETATEIEFADNLREDESNKEYANIGYSDIIGSKGLYTQQEFESTFGKSSLSDLIGDDFIKAVTKADPDPKDETGSFPLLDSYGRPTDIYKDYAYTKTTTKQLEVLGVPVNYIYNNNETTFLWVNLNAHPEDYFKTGADGNAVTVSNIGKADISLMFADVNMHLLRILKSLYSDFRFYTEENAVKCINYLGNLFYNNFQDFNAATSNIFNERDYVYSSGNTYYVDEEVFFKKVADLSGFSDLIQSNWLDYGTVASNYLPLIRLIGITEETLLDSEYYRGDKIAAAILKTVFTKVMGEGPLNYFLGVFESLLKGYHVYYHAPLRLLFEQKMSYYDKDGKHIVTTEEEFATITGLLNLFVNGGRTGDKNYFQFAPLPEKRLAMIDDKAEFYLTLLVYFNVNAHYLGNYTQINTNFIKTINALPISNAATTDNAGNIIPGYKTRLINIIKDISGDNLESIFYNGTLADLTIENISSKPSEYWGNVKEALAKMIKQIADWFQMWIDIFTGELEFGAGAFE